MPADADRPNVDALERLSRAIAQGDVVPFVGAGYSIDSEGNSATALVQRLLLRLLSLSAASAVFRARDLVGELKKVFCLEIAYCDPWFPFTAGDVEKLKDRYYETNDWFCRAFSLFLSEFAGQGTSAWPAATTLELARQVAKKEREIVAASHAIAFSWGITLQAAADVERDLPELLKLVLTEHEEHEALLRTAGKALFLDTMGFRDFGIMAGKPALADPREVVRGYGRKLLPRHHVLARFAREGLCTTTITSNYDLLLEGAFRQAGFDDVTGAQPLDANASNGVQLPHTTYERFSRITSPRRFFSDGKDHRTPVLVKVHGCADAYRSLGYDVTTRGNLELTLRTMVFTYREIQNWREDSWAADYLRTLLRTRVVVFIGYSLADPVIHDTFRTVYEEMAREHRRVRRATSTLLASQRDPPTPTETAPAYFFTPQSQEDQFCGAEVLAAASAAVGAPRPEDSHPNRISFYYRDDAAHFPNLDEAMRWLYHRTQRHLQGAFLETDLRRTVSLALSKPRTERELRRLRDRIRKLHADEHERALAWTTGAESRHSFARLASFSEFTAALLREFATIDLLQQRGRPNAHIAELRSRSWYYPTSGDVRWTCWAGIVELALRRMVARAYRLETLLEPDFMWAVPGPAPTLFFRGEGEAPRALTIHLAGFEPVTLLQRLAGHPVRHCFWQLTASHFPRTGDRPPSKAVLRSGTRTELAAPTAELLFDWASKDDDALDDAEARHWLGFAPEAKPPLHPPKSAHDDRTEIRQ